MSLPAFILFPIPDMKPGRSILTLGMSVDPIHNPRHKWHGHGQPVQR